MSQFIMLVGIPASGKSIFNSRLYNLYTIHSIDKMREELYGNVQTHEHDKELLEEFHKRIINDLRSNKNVIMDACNTSRKRRMAFLERIKDVNCFKTCIIFATPYKECLENNKNREKKVSEEEIKEMYESIQIPHMFEGWNDVKIKYPKNVEILSYKYKKDNHCLDDKLDQLKLFNQGNPHHNQTLGWHLINSAKYIFNNSVVNFKNVGAAALLHDIGKQYTKTFTNYKGEATGIAHYFGHDSVSAYESLFYGSVFGEDVLERAVIINYHMMPYVWEKDNNKKLENKWHNILGEDLFDKIMLVHEADKNSH